MTKRLRERKKFGFIARGLEQDGFGVSTYIRELYGAILSHAQSMKSHDNVEFVFFTDSDTESSRQLSSMGGIVHKLSPVSKSNSNKFIWDHWSVPCASKEHGIDVLFAPFHVAPLCTACPTIVCIHDMMYHLFPRDWGLLEKWYMRLGVNQSVDSSAAIIVDSQSTKVDLMNICKVPEDKVFTVYPGVPNYMLSSHIPANDFLESMNSDRGFFLAVGSNHPRKNMRFLLEAYEQVVDEISHDLVIVGPEFGIDKGWSKTATMNRLGNRVAVLGIVSQTELVWLYRNAQALLFPSVYEGFGFPVLEAMSVGCPVVAFQSSSMPEIVGDSGILAPLHDVSAFRSGILRFAQDQVFRDACSKESVSVSGAFQWSTAAEQLLTIMSQF